ncbi:DUF4810 domain-containing protein [Saccharophagus degradans]|uniref:Lipoprotein n=1 Tax=Saccharophagus degradans (strain 2-40 / ATCC 43961 / DSM 17024) TaxID=203122 RepID=Q21E36_SACD2|nr:DUF4810 domain-containing protein [Saccharophagus degradans]ABD83043.1 conserved hypothetical protein [Saccharophagus degradans 2-40]
MINKRIVIITMALLLLGGCGATSQYKWGNYESNMFEYYHEPGRKDKAVSDHLKMVASPVAQGQRLAPGMLAEAGTFYMEQGDLAKAIEYYQLEKAAWPESTKLMDALIENLQEKVGPK